VSEGRTPDQVGNSVRAVYELREAAVEHGIALAQREALPTAASRDQLLATQLELEEKTVAALDECADHTERGPDAEQ
jgi:hypothetical protein